MPQIPANANPQGMAILGLYMMGCLFGCFAAWTILCVRLAQRQPVLPRRPWPRVSWSGGAVAGSIGAWLSLNLVAGTALHMVRSDPDEITSLDKMGAISVINLILMIALPLFLGLWTSRPLRELGVPGPNWLSDAALGSAAAFLLAPVIFTVQVLCTYIWKPNDHPLKQMVLDRDSALPMVLAFVAAVILAPIAEELMFRGILQGWLERRVFRPRAVPIEAPEPVMAASVGVTDGLSSPMVDAFEDFEDPYTSPKSPAPKPAQPVQEQAESEPPSPFTPAALIALLFPAVLFSGVHYAQWPAPIPLMVLALGLGALYRRTGSLVAPIAMHATFNAFSTVALILASYLDLIPPELLK